MADQDDPYAAIAKPIAQQADTDPYASIAKPINSLPSQTASSKPNLIDTLRSNWHSNTDPVEGQGISGAIHNVAGRTAKTLMQPLLHPVDTVSGLLKTVATSPYDSENPVNQRIQEFGQEYQKSPSLAFENAGGDVLGTLLGSKVAGAIGETGRPLLENVGNKMQGAGEGLINRTIGATKTDFNRGANPGKGYFQAGFGPSMSMRSIAEKAANAHDIAGQGIGEAIRNGTGQGILIPAAEGVKPIAAPLNQAHAVMSGPGGGGAGAIEELSSTFRPSVQNAAQKGGFTPQEYFDVKRNVAKNTSWGDPSQIGLKSVRQQITGGMGNTLAEHVPELRDLNSVYQNTGKLADRAAYRSDTGISPLTQMGRRAAEGALGAGLGYATGHPLFAAAPLVLDSVPVRTGLASALNYGGKVLPGITPPAFSLAGAGGAIPAINKKYPDHETDK